MAFEQKRDDRDILSGFALITPFRMYLVVRNSILLHANNKGADQPAHPRSQLALESTLHAKNENKKFYRQTCVCGSRQLQRGRGGGGDCFSMEVRTSFSSRKYMTTCNFPGGGPGPLPLPPPPSPPLPLCLRPYQSFKQFECILESPWTYVLPGLVDSQTVC